MRRFRRFLVDIFIAIFALPAGYLLRRARRGWRYVPVTRRVLRLVGVFPVRNHYYEPVVYAEDLRRPLDQERELPGLDLNVSEQLTLLEQFRYEEKLLEIPPLQTRKNTFAYYNGSFEVGDAEFLYSSIRYFKPQRIVEIGSGHSTLLARLAIDANQSENPEYECRHTCIEPYEQPWLEQTGAEIVRQRAELCDVSFFKSLGHNDILFIDSSHVIRPQGDVLFEFLEVLGRLDHGVIVHIHDIFTPRDYLESWVIGDQKLWNEQYLLESFLMFNNKFRVIGALNYLRHNHFDALAAACPILRGDPAAEPRSFWIQRK
jgi:hypothetical protein